MSEVADLVDEVRALRRDVEAYGSGLHSLADAQGVANEKLDLILEALTKEAEPGPSPVHDLLKQIVKHLEEQTPVLLEIRDAVAPKPNGAGRL